MFDWYKNRVQGRAKAQKLYGAVVTLARTPGFYSHFGVPDTPEGRFEMLALCLFLVLERLRGEAGSEPLIQSAIEAFVTDMDDCMREMGVGDVVVPKRVKKAAAAFYERAGAYRTALAQTGGGALGAALNRHVFQGMETAASGPLAAAALRMKVSLDQAAHADVADGRAVAALSPLIPAQHAV